MTCEQKKEGKLLTDQGSYAFNVNGDQKKTSHFKDGAYADIYSQYDEMGKYYTYIGHKRSKEE